MPLFKDDTTIEPKKEIIKESEEVVKVEKSIVRLEIGQYEYIEIDIANTSMVSAKQQVLDAVEIQSYKNSIRTSEAPAETKAVVAEPTEKKTYEKIPFLKVEDDQEYTVKVVSDDGEFSTKFGQTHGFTVEVDGEKKKLTTTARDLLDVLVADATVTFKRYKEDNRTKFEVK